MYFIPTILVQGIYTGIISTISTVTMGTCRLITSIYTYENPNANRIIKELDVDRKLVLIQSVLNVIDKTSTPSLHQQQQQLQHQHQHQQHQIEFKLNDLEKTLVFEMVGAEPDLKSDPIELCLMFLHEIIKDIHADLKQINDRIAYHKTKWFNSWRSLDLSNQIASLKLNSRLLDNRFDDLTKISIFLANKK